MKNLKINFENFLTLKFFLITYMPPVIFDQCVNGLEFFFFQASNPEDSDPQVGDLPVAVEPDDAPQELGPNHQRVLRRSSPRRVRSVYFFKFSFSLILN